MASLSRRLTLFQRVIHRSCTNASKRWRATPQTRGQTRDYCTTPDVKKLTVVLDMDECLIHSTEFSDEPGSYRQHEDSRAQARQRDQTVDKFTLSLEDGVTCTVYKRPGLDAFLRACCARYDTYVFTAGTQPYADPLLDKLDGTRTLLKGRFFRNHCRPVRIGGSGLQYLKDLTAVTDDMRHCCPAQRPCSPSCALQPVRVSRQQPAFFRVSTSVRCPATHGRPVLSLSLVPPPCE